MRLKEISGSQNVIFGSACLSVSNTVGLPMFPSSTARFFRPLKYGTKGAYDPTLANAGLQYYRSLVLVHTCWNVCWPAPVTFLMQASWSNWLHGSQCWGSFLPPWMEHNQGLMWLWNNLRYWSLLCKFDDCACFVIRLAHLPRISPFEFVR